MRRKKTFVITVLLLIVVLIAAGCGRSSNTTPVATAPENSTTPGAVSEQTTPPAAAQDPAASAGAQNTGQPQQTTPGEEKKPPSTQPTTPAPAASLVLGKGQNAQNGEITDISTTFKAGEKFYYRFDNGGPFGVDKLSLQYADPASGTVINQYGIYVDSTSRYDSATMSFKTPGAYKIIIQVNGVERASKVVIIE